MTGVSLVLSEIFPPRIGGSGNWLHDIYRRQAASRTVLLVGGHEEDEPFDAASNLRIVRTDLPERRWTLMTSSGIAAFARLYRATARVHRMHRCSEIHCGRVLPEGLVGLLVSRRFGTPFMCYVHGEDIEIARYSREHRWLAQKVISHATRLVCNCENSRSLLLSGWEADPDRVRVLNPGIDTDTFRPAVDRDAVRASLGWSDKSVVLTVSRLDPRKGHDRMIDALKDIAVRVPNVHYAIVGGNNPDNERTLRALVHRLGLEDRVSFLGDCTSERMLHCYQGADLFVLPNRQIGGNLEGFGIVLLEAQACGQAVIAGDSGGTAETMIPGETGWLVDCEQADNLVEPVATLLLDDALRGRMGARARSWMLERFSWPVITDHAGRTVFLGQPDTHDA